MTRQDPQTKLILFDFDGVLADSLAMYEKSMILTFQTMGRPIVTNRAEYLDLFEDNLFDGLIKKGVDLEEFFRASTAIARPDVPKIPEPFFQMIPVVKALKDRHTLLIISSNGTETIRNTLVRHDFLDCFAAILGADFNFSKKEKIEQVILLHQADRQQTYYVGDTTGDIREAKQAGVKTVAVTWGWHNRERLRLADPDYLIDTPEELLSI